jgi:hypothetical protein
MSINVAQFDLPEEVTVRDAAGILGVDPKTVIGYITEGVLPARNIALPSSKRPVWRLKLGDVVELRTGYVRQEPAPQNNGNGHPKRCRAAKKYEPKVLKRN